MPRFEDLRLVRGAGKYSDDISMEVTVEYSRSLGPWLRRQLDAVARVADAPTVAASAGVDAPPTSTGVTSPAVTEPDVSVEPTAPTTPTPTTGTPPIDITTPRDPTRVPRGGIGP
jgi:hypothetical protein